MIDGAAQNLADVRCGFLFDLPQVEDMAVQVGEVREAGLQRLADLARIEQPVGAWRRRGPRASRIELGLKRLIDRRVPVIPDAGAPTFLSLAYRIPNSQVPTCARPSNRSSVCRKVTKTSCTRSSASV